MTDQIVEQVCAKLRARSAVGISKYGITLHDSKEEVRKKLQHLQEELMDACNYIEWILSDERLGS